MKQIKFGVAKRGGVKIKYNNYIQFFSNFNKNTLSWKCATRLGHFRLHTDHKEEVVIYEGEHEKEKYKIMKLKINNKLENFAIKTNIPFDNAIVETTLKLSNDEQKILRILLTYVIIMLEYED